MCRVIITTHTHTHLPLSSYHPHRVLPSRTSPCRHSLYIKSCLRSREDINQLTTRQQLRPESATMNSQMKLILCVVAFLVVGEFRPLWLVGIDLMFMFSPASPYGHEQSHGVDVLHCPLWWFRWLQVLRRLHLPGGHQVLRHVGHVHQDQRNWTLNIDCIH